MEENYSCVGGNSTNADRCYPRSVTFKAQVQDKQTVFLNEDANSNIILIVELEPGLVIPSDRTYQDYLQISFEGLDAITTYSVNSQSSSFNKTSLSLEIPSSSIQRNILNRNLSVKFSAIETTAYNTSIKSASNSSSSAVKPLKIDKI